MMRNDGGPTTKAPPPVAAPLHHHQEQVMIPLGKSKDAKEERQKLLSNSHNTSARTLHAPSRTFSSARPTWTHGRSNTILSKTQSDKNVPFLQSNQVNTTNNNNNNNNNKTFQQTATRQVSTNHQNPTQNASHTHTMSMQNKNISFQGQHMSFMNMDGGILAHALGQAHALQQDGQQTNRSASNGIQTMNASCKDRPMFPMNSSGILVNALGQAQALQEQDGQQKCPASSPKNAPECHDDSDGNASLAGMNGVEYIAKPDIGEFAVDSDGDSSDDDDDDDGFWDCDRNNRSSEKDEEQSVIIIDSPSPSSHEKESSTGKREGCTLPFSKNDKEATADEESSPVPRASHSVTFSPSSSLDSCSATNQRERKESQEKESPPSSPGSHSTISSPPTSPDSVSNTSSKGERKEAEENESPLSSPASRSVLSSPPTSPDSVSNNGEKVPSPVVGAEDETNVTAFVSKKRKQDSSLFSFQDSDDLALRKRNKPSEEHTAENDKDTSIQVDDSAMPAPKKAPRKRRVSSKSTKRKAVQNATGLRVGERVYAIWDVDGSHYWGVVTGGNDTAGYSIIFDDDDTMDGVARKDILTVQMFRDQKGKYAPPLVERESDALPLLTLEELYEAKCRACVNCDKEDCGLCASCISNDGSSRRKVCLQKMCCNIALTQKAQPMPPASMFPVVGWKYVMDPTRKSYNSNGKILGPSDRPGAWGLKIIPPAGQEFYTLERAIRMRSLDGVNVDAFYQHIGAPKVEASLAKTRPLASTNGSVKGSAPASKSTAALIQKPGHSQSARRQTFAPSESFLPKYRKVGSRVCCMMEDETEHWGRLEEKHGSGSLLSFTVRLEADDSLLERLEPACVLSEFHYKQETGKHPPPQSRTPVEALQSHQEAELSSAQVTTYMTTKDDPLVGKNVCFSWTDLEGRKKLVYGVVSECKKNEQTSEAESFKVIYNSKSREIVNQINNGNASFVPAESQMLPASLVRGGCIRYDRQFSLERQAPGHYYWNWITPDMRHEDFVEIDGVCQPRLTLVVRGYRLELNVRQSSIPNAGHGVYVSCTPLFDGSDSESLVLKGGELVDLGLYGPFRVQDKKKKAVFFAKNFIHSHKCEEWAFDSGDAHYQVDITDDVTGDIHSEAKRHIFAYVNESDLEEQICIHAEHDAEGNVHYLLGHSQPSQGDFEIPSNGDPMESFVYYGYSYEKVRLRKGYSFLPDGDEKNRLLQEIANEDVDYVKEIYKFGPADAEVVVDYMLQLFIKNDVQQQASTNMAHRALVVATVLQCRARQLFFEHNKLTNEDASVDLKKLLSSSANLVTLLLDMIRADSGLKMLHTSGSIDKLCALVLKRQFSSMELCKSSKLEDLMGD